MKGICLRYFYFIIAQCTLVKIKLHAPNELKLDGRETPARGAQGLNKAQLELHTVFLSVPHGMFRGCYSVMFGRCFLECLQGTSAWQHLQCVTLCMIWEYKWSPTPLRLPL